MQKILILYARTAAKIGQAKDLPLLFIRLVLAYGFYGPARAKWSHINDVITWFSGLNIPAPKLNAYLAAGTEATGVVLLILGLATRLISIPLIITMIVAVKTVHWSNGFEAADNGYEIPLYYTLMLFLLLISGPGRISIDYLIKKKTFSSVR